MRVESELENICLAVEVLENDGKCYENYIVFFCQYKALNMK